MHRAINRLSRRCENGHGAYTHVTGYLDENTLCGCKWKTFSTDGYPWSSMRKVFYMFQHLLHKNNKERKKITLFQLLTKILGQ